MRRLFTSILTVTYFAEAEVEVELLPELVTGLPSELLEITTAPAIAAAAATLPATITPVLVLAAAPVPAAWPSTAFAAIELNAVIATISASEVFFIVIPFLKKCA